ncbi:MAG TPA: YceI family protein [Sandaracinaceae bacterium LLY-WYZ-13_1]|nr:YceI family protein [Sandaracinaceae bacterium LLY-WYZ-13_1]
MRTTIPSLTLTLALVLGVGSLAEAQTREFEIRNDGGSRIQFISDAPLETITGVSSHVTGDVRVNPNDLSSARGTVRVRVASIRTGIDLRDEHLRSDNWLDAQAHPNATFEIRRVEGASQLQPNRSTRVRLHGRFSLHGVTRDVVANARVRLIPLNDELRRAHIDGDVIRAQASFDIELSDYDVSVPLPVRLKVSNEIRVNVTIRAIASDDES